MVIEYSLQEIDDVARQLLHSFTYPIVAIVGQMGSGKTTLIQSIVSQLGSEDTVSSPTFGLVHQYTTTKGEVIHMDLYRLEKKMNWSNLVLKTIYKHVTYASSNGQKWLSKLSKVNVIIYISNWLMNTNEN